MPRIADLPAFDASAYLDTPEARAEYLTAMMEDGTDDEIRYALGVIARAAGAEDRALPRGDETMMITGEKPSEFATVVRMMKSWGIALSAAPLPPAE